MNSEMGQQRRVQPAFQTAEQTKRQRACAACGTHARRDQARFCATCGHELEGGYFPADTLRASYHRQHQAQTLLSRQGQAQSVSSMIKNFPAQNHNGASTTALAFVTYALVPYLGILFCPGAVLMGSIGLVRFRLAPQHGGRRASYTAIILGLVILCIQIFLWWLLYKVPQWARMP